MLPAGSWVGDCVGNKLVGLEIERVTDNELIGFASAKLTYLDKVVIRVGIRCMHLYGSGGKRAGDGLQTTGTGDAQVA